MKFIIRLALIFLFFLLAKHEAHACVGARPYGMGGSFVAVADDINAGYWNPAGLAGQTKTVFTSTIVDDSKNGVYKMAYPYYFSAGSLINDRYWTLTYIKVAETFQSIIRGKSWLYLATGDKIDDRLSVGISFGYREVDKPSLDFSKPPREYYAAIPFFLNLGVLYKLTDQIKLGVMSEGIVNIRPGLSINPIDGLILSYEEYDMFDAVEQKASHFGVEYKMFGALSLRTGWYGVRTYGIGLDLGSFAFDCFAWGAWADPEKLDCYGYSVTYTI
jgi:hypothetical protein